MPVVDGITSCKIIRSYEEKNNIRRIPIVIITGNCSSTEKNQCLDPQGTVRANFFYPKPLTMTDCRNFTSCIIKSSLFGAPGSGDLKHFLVVGDDPFNVQLLTHFLQKEHVEVDSARNGLEALQKVKSEKSYGAILMDCEMPGLDGISATLEIKRVLSQSKRADIPIYGINGHVDLNYQDKCRNAGMSRVFTNPVNFDSLIKVILDS